MPIIPPKPKSGNWAPAPEGLHLAVCCDVWEPWTEERDAKFGGGLVDKTMVVWLVEEINPATKQPYEVSRIYTFSLHEKATLCQHLEAWRGKKLTEADKEAFDLEKLIGANCQLQVIHNITDKATYANIQAIVPAGKNMAKLSIPPGYVRKKDRSPKAAETSPVNEDAEVPF